MREKLNLPIISKTPRERLAVRGKEIKSWLNDNEINNYCIIDDDNDMLQNQMNNFVRVNSDNGFSFDNYEQAILILSKEA